MTMAWQTECRKRTVKGKDSREAARHGPTPALSLTSCVILNESLYYIGTKHIIGRF